MHIQRMFFRSALLILAISITGCDVTGGSINSATQQAVQVLSTAIDQLSLQSADWQAILQDAQAKLTEATQMTIRNEISTVLQRAEQAATSNILCVIDFLRVRVREDLIRIRQALLNQPIDPVTPVVCSVVPDAVHISADSSIPTTYTQLTIAGYNFDATPGLEMWFMNGTQNTNETAHIHTTSHYEMVIDIGGSGIPVSAGGQKLQLRWKNQTLSDIPIIQDVQQCQTKVVPVQFAPITVTPHHTQGDTNFGGSPKIWADLYPSYSPFRANAIIDVDIVELGGDKTAASASETVPVYTPPAEWQIKSISNDETSSVASTHSSNASGDSINPGTGWVVSFRFSHLDGDNAANEARVDISFREVQVTLQQVAGCR